MYLAEFVARATTATGQVAGSLNEPVNLVEYLATHILRGKAIVIANRRRDRTDIRERCVAQELDSKLPFDEKARQCRSANRGVLWTRLTARAGHGRAVGTEGAKGVSVGRNATPKIEGEKEGEAAGTRARGWERVPDAPSPWRCFRDT